MKIEEVKKEFSLLDALDYDSKEKIINEGLDCGLEGGWIYFQKGIIERNKNSNDKKSIILFNKSLSVEPGFYPSEIHKGISLKRLGLNEEAVLHFEKIIKKRPDDQNLIIHLSLAHQGRKDFKSSIDVLQRAVSNSSANTAVNDHLLQVLFLNEEWDSLFLRASETLSEGLETSLYFFCKLIVENSLNNQEESWSFSKKYINNLLVEKKTRKDFVVKSIKYAVSIMEEYARVNNKKYSFEKEIRLIIKDGFKNLIVIEVLLNYLWKMNYHSDVIDVLHSHPELDLDVLLSLNKTKNIYIPDVSFSEIKRVDNSRKNVFLITFPRTGSSFFLSLFDVFSNSNTIYEPFNSMTKSSFTDEQTKKSQKILNHTFSGCYFKERDSLKSEEVNALLMSRMGTTLFCNEKEFPADLVAHELWLESLLSNSNSINVAKFTRACFIIPWLKKLYPNSLIVTLHRDVHDIYNSMRQVYEKSHSRPFVDEVTSPDLFNIPDIFENLLNNYGFSSYLNERFSFYYMLYVTYSFSEYLAGRYSDLRVNYEDLINGSDEFLEKVASINNSLIFKKDFKEREKEFIISGKKNISNETMIHMANEESRAKSIIDGLIEKYELENNL